LTRAVPATTRFAERKDVPVYLTGLGTVQAFNTIRVKVRVDEQLDKVNFTEGRDVKAGDVLAQIDPRPFRAALDLPKATKAKVEAQLENARLDRDSGFDAAHRPRMKLRVTSSAGNRFPWR
jgi:multidrug efflux system membrane fusion protein